LVGTAPARSSTPAAAPACDRVAGRRNGRRQRDASTRPPPPFRRCADETDSESEPQSPDTRQYDAVSPGTGISHLAVALGVEAVKAGRSVYFTTLADIIGALAKAEREGQLRERIRWFCRSVLLIVDEIGYLPVVAGGGNLFFQLVNARYERGAMILTSNRGFAEWGDVFGDPVVATALLDRLLHHAVVIQIEGSSYRLRQHADLMPEHLRSKALINPPFPAALPRRRRRSPKLQSLDQPPGSSKTGEIYFGTNEETSPRVDSAAVRIFSNLLPIVA
jgi:hypothetical protein